MLKQAPRAWNSTIDSYLLSLGLTKSSANCNLYYAHDADRIALLLLYVDDIYLLGDHSERLTLLRSQLKRRFDMTDLGQLSHSLEVEYLFSSSGIIAIQQGFVLQILEEFGMLQCNPARVPLHFSIRLQRNMAAAPANFSRYQRLVGKLFFLTHTHPDIAYAVSILCRFTSQPQLSHFHAALHLLRYLRGTTHYGLQYRQGGGKSRYQLHRRRLGWRCRRLQVNRGLYFPCQRNSNYLE